MRRGTTPTITINIGGIDINEVVNWYVTIEQDELQITKTEADIDIDADESRILVPITQAETLALRSGKCHIQLRLVMDDGNRIASDIYTQSVESILYEEEI